MPAPSARALSDTAKLNFAGRGIALPVQWHDMGHLHPQAFTPAERSAPTNPTDNLFREPTLNRYHTGSARTIGRRMARYIEKICAAIADAIEKWMGSASVTGININGPIGSVPPGGVLGPLIEPFIMAGAPRESAMEREYSRAIAAALSQGWQRWQQGLSGVLAYPGFAAAPMPVAPPTANVPAPLITFTSCGEEILSPAALKTAMHAVFSTEGQHADALFDALSCSFFLHFQVFKASTRISRVIGTGPVTVAPTGPVTGGSAIPTPGNFI